ncbi:MAG: hypothetical protein AB7T06_33680 [Kofleriaceae bacterium]
MIGLPFNDLQCLASVTEVVAELVRNEDVVITELAAKHPTTESLVAYIRTLPQRDDLGDKTDGPRVDVCDPPQRLRIPAEDPNCVERAALYVAVAEIIDPNPVRQLATLDTPVGMHTFPVENGAPVILDPRLPRNCLDCGVQFLTQSPIVIDPRDAIDWTAQLAEAGAANLRNGPSRVRKARNAIVALVDEGAAPADAETIDSIGWLLSLAERVARKYGPRALAVVRTTAQAIAELADEALARAQRNFALEIAGRTMRPAPWMSMLAKIAGRVGMNIGAVALDAKLKSMGIGGDMVGLVENELNREGLTLGAVARPPKLPTFERMFKPAA